MTRVNAILFAAVAAALMPGAAGAGPAPRTQQVPVYYGDLNLNSASGRDALTSRLQQAANHICGERPDSRDLATRDVYRHCTTEVLARAESDIRTHYAAQAPSQTVREASDDR